MNKITNYWVWQMIDQTLSDELVVFWLSQNAMQEEQQARQRVYDVIMIARNASGQLVGITSMERKFLSILSDDYLFLRQYVRKDLRQSGVASSMGIEAWYILENLFQKKEIKEKGLVVEIQNKKMNAYLTAAVLQPIPFVFIGYTAKGRQIRVSYFKGALI